VTLPLSLLPSGDRPVEDHPQAKRERHGEVERWIILAGFAVYLVVVTGALVIGGYFPSIDLLALAFFPVAILMRRGSTFLADWVPFAIVLLAYEQFRGMADHWNGTVHVENVIAVERFLFGDPIPTVRLQQWFYEAGQTSWLDISMTAVYMVHFAGVLGLAFWLWLRRDRRVYWRYVLALLLLSYLGFATYALFPVAPPRFAAAWGHLPPVADVFMDNFSTLVIFQPFFTVYQWIDPNPFAAMPSLHIGYPVLFVAALQRIVSARWTWLLWLYPVVMTFAVVYLGHHYVVDALAGAIYAWVSLWIVWDAPGLVRPVVARLRGSRPATPVPAATVGRLSTTGLERVPVSEPREARTEDAAGG
jgi:membrane-associated phospholipid phosphatase